jgi:hypothetical protein
MGAPLLQRFAIGLVDTGGIVVLAQTLVFQVGNGMLDLGKVIRLVLLQIGNVHDGHENIAHFVPNVHTAIVHQFKVPTVNVDKVLWGFVWCRKRRSNEKH